MSDRMEQYTHVYGWFVYNVLSILLYKYEREIAHPQV